MSRGFIAAALPKTASLLQASDNEHPGHDLPQLVGSVGRKPLLLSLRLGHTHTHSITQHNPTVTAFQVHQLAQNVSPKHCKRT